MNLGRIQISGKDLNHIAYNMSAQIPQYELTCKHCLGLSNVGKFLLTKLFRGGNLPSTTTLVKKFCQYVPIPDNNDKIILEMEALTDWCKRHAEEINTVDITYISHFGRYSIQDQIDAVLFSNKIYNIVEFACKTSHALPINYRHYAASHWLREAFAVTSNGVIAFVPTGEIHSNIEIDTKELEFAIRFVINGD
jgi:hypothetical protein